VKALTRYKEAGPLKRVWRAINELQAAARSLKPSPGANVTVRHTMQGTVISAQPKAKAVEGGGMSFAGEWNSASSYAVDDVVVIRGGTEAGTYICTRAVTANAADVNLQPAQGLYWASLSRAHPLGTWR
jgi:uncharacterized membrane protein